MGRKKDQKYVLIKLNIISLMKQYDDTSINHNFFVILETCVGVLCIFGVSTSALNHTQICT
jgi:hypothetical protein